MLSLQMENDQQELLFLCEF